MTTATTERTVEAVIAEARAASQERDEGKPRPDETAIRKAAQEEFAKALALKIAPKGALKLPTLLDERRHEFGIIDQAFARQCVYDRILVYQIDMHQEETYVEGGLIIKSEIAKKTTRYHAARGIIVSAGLKAMDTVRSYGMELGHIINFISSAPWRLEVDHVAAIPFELLVMNAGDIICSEDLASNLLNRHVRLVAPGEWGKDERGIDVQNPDRHRYAERTLPVEPWTSDDS